MAVSKRSMSYLQGRARDNLSDWFPTGQNTKVFYRRVSLRTSLEPVFEVTPTRVGVGGAKRTNLKGGPGSCKIWWIGLGGYDG